ncbi:hypothetical protein QBC34DRAFT_125362 [Podospora aff. communis PSN243]|uniref:Uncharacterized protein n=1 Tax=Podospora aff. communis PSN243 TaxID=3040156 RepID=A0AAV9GLS3_9PEZI|nr:hypothetical protein QBC34DRAFT_125362 [Podospora aff. communis PSN243]
MESKSCPAVDDQSLEDLAEAVWGPFSAKTRYFNGDSTTRVPVDLSAYSNYFERQWDLIAKHSDGRYVMVKSRSYVRDIAQLLLNGYSRGDILEQLK